MEKYYRVCKALGGVFTFTNDGGKLLGGSLLFSFLSKLFSTVRFTTLFMIVNTLMSSGQSKGFVYVSLKVVSISLVKHVVAACFSAVRRARANCYVIIRGHVRVKSQLHCVPVNCFGGGDVKGVATVIAAALNSMRGSTTHILISILNNFFGSITLIVILLTFS